MHVCRSSTWSVRPILPQMTTTLWPSTSLWPTAETSLVLPALTSRNTHKLHWRPHTWHSLMNPVYQMCVQLDVSLSQGCGLGLPVFGASCDLSRLFPSLLWNSAKWTTVCLPSCDWLLAAMCWWVKRPSYSTVCSHMTLEALRTWPTRVTHTSLILEFP